MSNEEKKRLEEYRKRRARLILIQLCIFAILSAISVGLIFAYRNIDDLYYITYTESSSIDYKVLLKENDLYEEEYLGEDYVYVTSLMDNILADFNYKLNINAGKVSYDIKFKADAVIQIVDSNTNTAVYRNEYKLIDEVKQSSDKKDLDISIPLTINYDQHNKEVSKFIKALNLKSVKSTLFINVTFDVESQCDDFEGKNNSNALTLNIPLDTNICKISESQTVPTSNEKTIACQKFVDKNTILITTFATIGLDLICLIVLILFIYLTRNTHINYSIKIRKIVNSYKSFIQKINNTFDKTGYQVLYLNTIRELLEIRDTVQSPILMSENEDRTLTEFVIPTSNKILYVLEIKIENYDEIYGLKEENNILNSDDEIVENIEETTQNNTTKNETVEENIEEITQNSTTKSEILEENIKEIKNKNVSEETCEIIKEAPLGNNLHTPKIIIDNKGGYLLNVSVKTPYGHKIYSGNDKKKEIDLNSKKNNN